MKIQYEVQVFNRSEIPFAVHAVESDHVLSADSEEFIMEVYAKDYSVNEFNAISIVRIN